MFDSEMKRERVLQKGIQTDTEIIVFGGDFLDGLEIYNVKEKRWYLHLDVGDRTILRIVRMCLLRILIASPFRLTQWL
jgi:hypothetical protein